MPKGVVGESHLKGLQGEKWDTGDDGRTEDVSIVVQDSSKGGRVE